jgi:hypothetical protein
MAQADVGNCSVHTIVSVETGRLTLSKKLGWRISQATGCDFMWLTANDPGLAVTDHEGRRYTAESFKAAQDRTLKSLRFYRIEPALQLGVAYSLLHRTLCRVRTNPVAAPAFLEELEMFVRRMLELDPELKDQIYAEIYQWNRANVGAGKSFPKSFLFPRSAAPVELMRTQAEEGQRAVADRERRMEEQARKVIKK